MQFECSNGRHGRLGRLERLVRITQAAASLPPSRSCRPITLLLRGDTRQFQICSRKPRIPKDAGRSARSHVRTKSVRLADHHIVHKVSTRQLVEFSHGNPYQACSPPCSLRSYPSDCECLLNERGEYPVKTFGQLPDSVFKSYPDRWRSNIRFTSAPHRWHRYTTSSSSRPVVGMVGVTSDTLIGMRHLRQSWTSPAHIVLGSAVMGRLLHWTTNSALEWSFDQEGSRALQHSCLWLKCQRENGFIGPIYRARRWDAGKNPRVRRRCRTEGRRERQAGQSAISARTRAKPLIGVRP
jgi:hypothetical protein